MSHSLTGKRTTFHFNGDFEGNVTIDIDGDEMNVPFDDIKLLVAEYVRRTLISRLEDASNDAILLGDWNSNNTAPPIG